MTRILALAMMLYMPLSASAAPVWRCTKDGNTTYQMAPCPGGVRLDAAEPAQDDGQARAKLQGQISDQKRREREQYLANLAVIADQQARDDPKKQECVRIVNNMLRQQVWLDSPSPSARASAQTEMQIAERKWIQLECGR